MAADAANISVTNTLTSTTADTVTLKPGYTAGAHLLVVVNHDDANTIWFTWSGVGTTPTTAVAEADNAVPVLPGSSTSIRLPKSVLTCVVSVVGNADKYTCAVLPAVGL